MYISLWENYRGHPDNISFMQFSTKIDGFEQKDSQGFENSYNSYEQYPLEKFFIFTIYQNYTLALIVAHLKLWGFAKFKVTATCILETSISNKTLYTLTGLSRTHDLHGIEVMLTLICLAYVFGTRLLCTLSYIRLRRRCSDFKFLTMTISCELSYWHRS